MAKRRSTEEVLKLVAEIDRLRAGGMGGDEAAEKVGLSRSVYGRHKKKEAGGERGAVRADSLPPRPKKKGKRVPRPLNLNDIGAVATRITRLDKKLRDVEGLVRERVRLVAHLVTLLKPEKKK